MGRRGVCIRVWSVLVKSLRVRWVGGVVVDARLEGKLRKAEDDMDGLHMTSK